MKQTAVDWLFENWKNSCNSLEDMIGLFQQAKEMEKQQIIDAYEYTAVGTSHYGEQYYNETFKSE